MEPEATMRADICPKGLADMGKPVSKATVLSLEHFPAYDAPNSGKALNAHLAKYLKGLLDGKFPMDANYAELPSFSILAKFFDCMHLEIYDVFKSLRLQGYDYQFSSLDGAVLVWRTSKPPGDRRGAEIERS